ncbi:MAG: hypothetical protein Kilf2KO_20980 [Rhodospirillales bacterium]
MRLFLATLALVLLVGQNARGESAFWLERGHWWIGNTKDACVAGSRPSIEMNVSPFMSLELIYRPEGRELLVQANYWPDAFRKDQTTTMSLLKRGEEEIALPATAVTDYAILSDRGLTPKEIRELAKQIVLVVRAEGLAHGLGVQTIPSLRIIELDLKSCARFLETD